MKRFLLRVIESSMDSIMVGIVETRRKMYSPKKEVIKSVGERLSLSEINRKLKDIESTLMTVNWRLRKHDCDMMNLQNEMLYKEKAIENLMVIVNLLQHLYANLFQEKEELARNIHVVRSELKRRECVVHSDRIASIWKASD